VIPRTLTFLFHGEHVLLLKLAKNKGAWKGQYNGIGGHIEQGEDPLTAARREIVEETGLAHGELKLSGVIAVDTGTQPGIGLFIFSGQLEHMVEVDSGEEGFVEWISMNELDQYPLLEDIPLLLTQILTSNETGKPFSALYSYDSKGELQIEMHQ
jgi:8-oxo-dGTP diphosphatase